MPFNEDLLESTKTDIQNEVLLNNILRNKLRIIQNNLNEISLISEPEPTADDINATKWVLPNDPKLKVTITEERRLAIFEKLLEDISKL